MSSMNMGDSGTIVGMDEQKLVVAAERDDESSVAVLDRESSSIEILESGTEAFESANTSQDQLSGAVETDSVSRIEMINSVSTFEREPGPACNSFLYQDTDYKHRIEGVLVDFEDTPQRYSILDLETTFSIISQIAADETNLDGLGSTEKAVSRLRNVQQEGVTFAGYDVDIQNETVVSPQINYGLSPGKVTDKDRMRTYQQGPQSDFGVETHITDWFSSVSNPLLK